MGELGRIASAAVLAGAGVHLHAAALGVLSRAVARCGEDDGAMGRHRLAAGRLLVAAGECTLASLPESALDSAGEASLGEARARQRARLERLAELVAHAEEALRLAGELDEQGAIASDVGRALAELEEEVG